MSYIVIKEDGPDHPVIGGGAMIEVQSLSTFTRLSQLWKLFIFDQRIGEAHFS